MLGWCLTLPPSPAAPVGKVASLSLLHPALRAGWQGTAIFPDMVCDCAGEGQGVGAIHPQPGPYEGPAALPARLWGEVAFQHIPPTTGLIVECLACEHLPVPRLNWGGVYSVAHTAEDG